MAVEPEFFEYDLREWWEVECGFPPKLIRLTPAEARDYERELREAERAWTDG